jgi:hypothetical protein
MGKLIPLAKRKEQDPIGSIRSVLKIAPKQASCSYERIIAGHDSSTLLFGYPVCVWPQEQNECEALSPRVKAQRLLMEAVEILRTLPEDDRRMGWIIEDCAEILANRHE